jgi:hypothetical protein
MLHVRWTGNRSRYDGKLEDIPSTSVEEEDQPPCIEKTVRVRLQCGRAEKVWTGTVIEILWQPSALDLALPEKRAAAAKEVCRPHPFIRV